MDKKIKYYISNKTKYSYPILTKDVQCSNCKKFLLDRICFKFEKIEKNAHLAKQKWTLSLKISFLPCLQY